MDEKHRQFVKEYLSGLKPVDAYMAAFEEADVQKAYRGSYRLMRNREIRAEITRLQGKIDDLWLLTREEKRAILAKIILDEDGMKVTDRLKALEVDNRMAGHEAPVEVHATGIEGLIASIRGGANPQ